MKLTVVRHTKVDVPKGICYGVSDVDLAATAPNEIERIVRELQNEIFDVVYTSPLSRCRVLAKAIRPEQEQIADARLLELNFGDWEMASWQQIYESEEGKIWFDDYLHEKCPNGQSYMDIVAAMKDFITELQQKEYEHVLIVAHAGIIRTLISLTKQRNPFGVLELPIAFGDIFTFDI